MGQIPIISNETWYPFRPQRPVTTLLRWRRWYDDSGDDGDDGGDEGSGDAGEQDAGQDQDNSNGSEFRIEELPPAAQAYIKELRNEAASNRVALKNQQEEARKREQKRLKDEGKWKELAESREQALAEYEPYKERAETLDTVIREMNQERIARIPEDRKTLVPENLAPEELSKWLIRNEKLLSAPTAPDIDAGAGGGGGQQIKLSAEEKELAAKTGMSEEDFKKAREKLEKLSRG